MTLFVCVCVCNLCLAACVCVHFNLFLFDCVVHVAFVGVCGACACVEDEAPG